MTTEINKPSFEVKKVESPQKTQSGIEAMREVAAKPMGADGSLFGIIGQEKRPEVMTQVGPTEDEKARKVVIQTLLIRNITPMRLGSKYTAEDCRQSLIRKMDKSTLDNLVRFLPERLNALSTEAILAIVEGTESITDEERVYIQDKYKELSP